MTRPFFDARSRNHATTPIAGIHLWRQRSARRAPCLLHRQMRLLIPALVALAIGTPARAQDSSRARVIAALEHLIQTGEPRHNSHDEGEWLQAEVDLAFAANDTEVMRLARRAASPLVVNVTRVIAPTTDLPSLHVTALDVLNLPQPAPYSAEIIASVDGGDSATVMKHTGSGGEGRSIHTLLPQGASQPGRHSLRLSARIRFADRTLGTEVRALPELTYAIYDPAAAGGTDPRVFIDAARFANVAQLDPSLPAGSLGQWLHTNVRPHDGDFEPARELHWEGRYCDERTLGDRSYSAATDLCAVALLALRDGHNGIGRVWVRTGRVEREDNGGVRWVAVPPSVEAIQLRTTEVATLSELMQVLSLSTDAWPIGDVSVTPTDIRYARVEGALRVEAVVRNGGTAEARDVEILISTAAIAGKGPGRSFIRNLPPGGFVEVTAELPFTAAYGAVVVHARQLVDHTLPDRWSPDPTPEDAVAFRVIAPENAPPGYARTVVEMCGLAVCRGY